MTEYKKMRLNSGRMVYVHRYLMAKKLGRPLYKNEVVDHINGNKLDNRLSNLRAIDLTKHTQTHYKNGDYHKLTKTEMRKGANVTNQLLKRR